MASQTKTTRPEPTYGEIVWGQFKKNRIALVALGLLGLLAIIAICAPLISSSQPFKVTHDSVTRSPWFPGLPFEVTYDGKTSYPWLEGLLFNGNVYGKGIDIFFNLLLVVMPFIGIVYLIFRRTAMRGIPGRIRRKRRGLFIAGSTLIVIQLFIALLIFQPEKAVPDWKELWATGELIEVAVPPLEFSYNEVSFDVNRPPSQDHYLGTDSSGRDQFVRMLYGTRISLTIGVIAVSIFVFIGTVLGALAGYFGGKVDIVIQRLIEVVMSLPSFILILSFVSLLPNKSIFWIMLFIGITRWTTVARLVRGEFLKLKNVDFVQAAVAAGLKTRRVIFVHVLPNAMGPVLVAAAFGVADAILIEAGLSFLNVSDLEAPSWGRILKDGRDYHNLRTMLMPGIAIFFTVSVMNLIGEGLRDALDPKLRK